MAKKNRKKRLKRQLIKRNKEMAKVKAVVLPEVIKEFPRPELYLGKYAKENAEYQQQLDKVYGGTVIPVERYITAKANILHTCTECRKEFFSKPVWLLNKGDQRHVCGVDTVRSVGKEKKVRKIGNKEKAKMIELANQGMSASKIAVHLGISRPTVSKYLKEAGVS